MSSDFERFNARQAEWDERAKSVVRGRPKSGPVDAAELAELGRRQGVPSFVYFIRAGESGPIKIGWTADPVARLGALQVGNPERLRLIGVMVGGEREERALHAKLGRFRKSGEWFDSHPDVVELVTAELARVRREDFELGEGMVALARKTTGQRTTSAVDDMPPVPPALPIATLSRTLAAAVRQSISILERACAAVENATDDAAAARAGTELAALVLSPLAKAASAAASEAAS